MLGCNSIRIFCTGLVIWVIAVCVVWQKTTLLCAWIVWFVMVTSASLLEDDDKYRLYFPLLIIPLLVTLSPTIYIRIPLLTLATIYVIEVADKVNTTAICFVYTGLVVLSTATECIN